MLNEAIYTTKNPIVSPAKTSFANADGTTTKTIYTAPSTGTQGNAGADECVRITCIPVISTDTAAREFILSANHGNGEFDLGFLQIPANSGNGVNAANPSLNMLNAKPNVLRDGNGNPYYLLPRGGTLRARPRAAVTATFVVEFGVEGEEYKA